MDQSHFSRTFSALPLIPILRNIKPSESVVVANALADAGMKIVEVPLNSPDPLQSIEQIATHCADRLIVGAGTVLCEQDVADVAAAGGKIILSPNMDVGVIKSALKLGMVPIPGIATPTEAFSAIAAGAEYLKLFPAISLGSTFVRQIKAVLPAQVKILAVGGVDETNMQVFWQAGVKGFGIGSALYAPRDEREKIHQVAMSYISSFQALKT